MRGAVLGLTLLTCVGCVSMQEADALRRENARLRAEIEQNQAAETEEGTPDSTSGTPAESTTQSPPDTDAAPSPTEPVGDARTYVVKNRDALSDIAQRFYGDSTRWEELWHANRDVIGDDPNRLKVGMTLRIP